ncbi:MAG: PQQ-binding-like beta-propeller repeat protein [Gaiellaceae bacterium]
MRNFVLVDAKTGKVSYPPDARGGSIESAVTDGHGGWYIGGLFTRIGRVKRPYLAHLKADGTLDRSFVPDLPAGTIAGGFNSIAFGANTIFAAVGSSSGTGAAVIALDGRTGRRRWSTWNSGFPLAYRSGVLYVGWYSDKIVAALDPQTGKPTAWKVRGWSSEPLVSVITVAKGAVYVGGEFAKIGGIDVPCSVAGVSAKTGKVIWVPRKINACSTDFEIDSLVVSHGQVLTRVVHDFSSARFVSIDVKTGKILPWSNEIGDADPLAASGNTLYLGASGGFSNVGKARVNNLAAITLPSGTLENWSPNLGKCVSVGAAAVSGQNVLIAGHFAPRTCKA